MRSVHSVFFKSVVGPFYQRHAGLFLVFFLLMFGVVPPQNLLSYHQKLLEAFLGDSVLRIIVFACWLLYAFKCIQFVLQELEKKEMEFLFEANALNKPQRFFASFIALQWILLPIFMYALIAVISALNFSMYGEAFQVIVYSILLSMLSAFVVDYKISHGHDAGLSRSINFLSLRVSKPYVVIILMQVLNDLKIVFFITKLLSIICIYIALAFCDKGVYDIRVMMLGLLFSMIAHVTLLFELRKFEETKLLYMRNTHQAVFKKYVQYFLVVTILLLPEVLVLLNAPPEKIVWQQVPVLFIFCASMLLSFVASFYKLPFNKDKSIISPTYIVLVVFFLILYKVIALIIAGLFLYSVYLLHKNYYRFELVEEK
jgi:hypothetical protein